MGQLTVSVESGNSSSDDENADIESDDVSEEEEPSEEPVNRSCRGNNDQSSHPYYEKMNMPPNTMPGLRIHELSANQNPSNSKIVPEKVVTAGNTGRKRRSGWDIVDMAKELTDSSGSMNSEKGTTRGSRGSKKRKKKKQEARANENSQIRTSSPFKNPNMSISQEILQMQEQVFHITRKLQSGVVDGRAASDRSPSPPPVYNNLGIRINTREVRLRSKLKKQRQTIISELMCKKPSFKPPPDVKSTDHQRMINVPTKEHPGFNFIGHILGPRGRTLRRIEMETGAKLQLRGKCYGHEGIVWNNKPKPTDDELYVLVSADNRYSLDAAVAMVEKLLVPVEGQNEFQLAQLRELAELNGTLTNNYRNPDPCNLCGDAAHPTSACHLMVPASGTSSSCHQVNYFAGMGGDAASKPQKEIDDANLFIGQLPDSLDETKKLVELFSRFGPICQAGVIRDKITGLSCGYGFVKYTDRVYAAEAVAQMNGYKIEGKALIVRNSRSDPPPVNQSPAYPWPPAIPQRVNPDPMHWPRPPESRLPETVAHFAYTSRLPVHSNPFSGQYSASLAPSYQTPAASSFFSGGFVMSDELARFPGYLKSLDPPSQLFHQSTAPSSRHSSSQAQFPQNFGGYHTPPTRHFGM